MFVQRLLIFCCVTWVSNSSSFSWSDPVTLSAPWQTADEHQLAISQNNNAMAVWHRFDGEYQWIQASRFDSTTGMWDPIEDVATISPANRNSEYPSLAMDSDGNAFAVWRWYDGTNWLIRASRYDVFTKSWQKPINVSFISPRGFDCDVPQVAMSDNGTALAVWTRYSDPWLITVNIYSNGSWSGFVTFISAPAPYEDSAQPVIAMDPSGNGFAAWYQFDSSNWRILARRYVQGLGWQAGVSIFSILGFNAYNPQVAMDDQGNAVLAWQLAEGTGTWAVQSAYYQAGAGWVSVTNLATGVDVGSSSHNPFVRIAMSRSGKAIAAWYKLDGGKQYVQARVFDGSSWLPEATLSEGIEPINAFDNPAPRVAIDNNGRGIATWTMYEEEGKSRVQASLYNGSSWMNPSLVPIISEPHQSAHDPQVVMDSQGNGLIIWQRSDGTNVSTYAEGNKRIQAIYYDVTT